MLRYGVLTSRNSDRSFPIARSRRLLVSSAVALVVLGAVIAFVLGQGSPVLFGAYVGARDGVSQVQGAEQLESQLGRPLAAVRIFEVWDGRWPNEVTSWANQTGKVPVISVKAKLGDGQPVSWSSIANAQPGQPVYQQIVTWADRMRDWPGTAYFSFNHEPSNAKNIPNGTASDYVAAWDRMREVFDQEGAGNVQWVWIMGTYPFASGPTNRVYPDAWYPGDDQVDVLGIDVYNAAGCHGAEWQSFAQEAAGFQAFAEKHPGVPVMVTEFGSYDDPADPTRKAEWLADAQADLATWHGLVGVLTYDGADPFDPNCSWWVDSSQPSLDAYRAWAQDPRFGG